MMLYLVDKDSNQICGVTDNKNNIPGNCICVESEFYSENLYYNTETKTIEEIPEKPSDDSFWSGQKWIYPNSTNLSQDEIVELNTFESSALGSKYRYKKDQDFVNRVSLAIAANYEVSLNCRKSTESEWKDVKHTIEQLKLVAIKYLTV